MAVAEADQDSVAREGDRHRHVREADVPFKFPLNRAVAGRVGGQAVLVEDEDLAFAVQFGQARGTVTGAAVAPGPDRLAGGRVVGEERAAILPAGTDDNAAVHDQRGTGVAPLLGFVSVGRQTALVDWSVEFQPGIGRDDALPDRLAGRQIKAVKRAGGTERINPPVVDRRSRAWSLAGDGGLVLSGISMQPEQ